ncbi:ComEA family DNA-binding protein [Ruania zhangjianzhongii]|uniref:ComEA family DNA-binding protein n=1 Tax=Ruania zhangjianzhongii TaxID=2603206 RepID=UPI0011C959BC|nr:helix-hairpin-helix domain-containing protein [Ruania zhangjianzhongii]
MTAQRPRDRLRRLQLAAYEPAREAGGAQEADDGARHRAERSEGVRQRTSWALRPGTLARVALAVVLLGVLLAVAAVASGVLRLGAPGSPEVTPTQPTLPTPSAAPPASAAPSADGADSPGVGEVASAEAALYVHVAGAVSDPGLVQLAPGERVADAIAAAGGAAETADLDRVNLAAPVTDGEQVYVPAEGETPPALPEAATGSGASDAEVSAAVVNVNTAGAEELETLPGIGPARAADIIAHREEDGPFESVEDLLAVPGIGPATLDRLRERVRL